MRVGLMFIEKKIEINCHICRKEGNFEGCIGQFAAKFEDSAW
jgi:hypothetical protein